VFTRIEARNYRCFKEVSQTLNPFEILVGPNGSGKSTFLDVIGFLSDFASDALAAAVERRTENFHDLVFGRSGTAFQLSVDMDASGAFLELGDVGVRYSARFRLDTDMDRLVVGPQSMGTILRQNGADPASPDARADEFFSLEMKADHSSFLPDSMGKFPDALGNVFRYDVRTVELDARALERPSPAGSAGEKRITGAGLARLIANLKSKHPLSFQDWLSHVRTALPEIHDIDSIPRPWENTRYVVVRYPDNVEVPSWALSEGTLRLLQLTILAYLPDFHGIYLIEEPENGVHPSALETIYQSLSSIYDAQVLVSSHSPILLNMARPEQLLCFSKSSDGVKIVRGNDHPALKDWQNEVSLGTLAASGILG
jgi:predicted ATPase